MVLKDPIKLFIEGLSESLHSGVRDVKRIHTITFTTFLEAALSLRNKRRDYEWLLSKVKGSIYPFHTLVMKLVPDAAKVIREVEEAVRSSTITAEASTKIVCKRIAYMHRGRIDYVFVIDALSPIEFASLIITANRNGFECNLSREFFINPIGLTWFVKEQVDEERKRLRNYAKELAEAVGCTRYNVSFTFDDAIHTTLGDVTSFILRENGKNPLEGVWMEIIKTMSGVEPNATILLTTDHGYSVYEGDGMLFVNHGIESGRILYLEPIALFSILKVV